MVCSPWFMDSQDCPVHNQFHHQRGARRAPTSEGFLRLVRAGGAIVRWKQVQIAPGDGDMDLPR
jgi:hypothetical protein